MYEMYELLWCAQCEPKPSLVSLNSLPTEHARVLELVKIIFATNPKCAEFSNYWRPLVRSLFDMKSGKGRRSMVNSSLYRICEDMESRVAIARDGSVLCHKHP